jgi:allophanate hydrolase subunit 2
MEITMTGPKLEFDVPTYIAISGARISPEINGKSIAINQVHKVSPGDLLSFGKLEYGFRAYLAVKNGFGTKEVMGSRSFYSPITEFHHLKDQMELPIDAVPAYEAKISSLSPEPFHKEHVLEVFRAPEYNILNDKQLEALFSRDFSISKENNRMGYQLQETIEGHAVEMLTSATLPGTVELTPSGKILLLMKDGQTTGGYPRILQLTETAICILSQKKFGDKVNFHLK